MASPIDEIFIKLGFKTDDKDIDKTKKKVDDLLDNTDKKSKKADISFNNIFKTVRRMAVAAGAAYIAFDRLANSMLKSNQAYINFNRQTGLALANVNKIAGAGMLVDYNLNPENVMGSMQALESNLAQIRLGEGNIAPFQLLGISPVGKDAVQVIEDLRQAIKGIDDMTATNIIQQMGLSPEMLTILRMSREEMQQYSAIANQYMLSPEQRQAMQQYAMGLRLVHMQLNYLKDTIILKVIPAFINFSKNFANILQQGSKFIDIIQNVLKMIPQLKLALGGLTMFILARFNPIIAALTGLYLIIEDIAVWFAGGKSITGKLFGNRKKEKTPTNFLTENFDKILNNPLTNMIIKPLSPDINNHLLTPLPQTSSINNNRTVTQNNYITTSSFIPQQVAMQTTDLMNAELQIDTSY